MTTKQLCTDATNRVLACRGLPENPGDVASSSDEDDTEPPHIPNAAEARKAMATLIMFFQAQPQQSQAIQTAIEMVDAAVNTSALSSSLQQTTLDAFFKGRTRE